jgi:hypothetical protein
MFREEMPDVPYADMEHYIGPVYQDYSPAIMVKTVVSASPIFAPSIFGIGAMATSW